MDSLDHGAMALLVNDVAARHGAIDCFHWTNAAVGALGPMTSQKLMISTPLSAVMSNHFFWAPARAAGDGSPGAWIICGYLLYREISGG